MVIHTFIISVHLVNSLFDTIFYWMSATPSFLVLKSMEDMFLIIWLVPGNQTCEKMSKFFSTQKVFLHVIGCVLYGWYLFSLAFSLVNSYISKTSLFLEGEDLGGAWSIPLTGLVWGLMSWYSYDMMRGNYFCADIIMKIGRYPACILVTMLPMGLTGSYKRDIA